MATVLVLGSEGNYGKVVSNELLRLDHSVIRTVHTGVERPSDRIYRIDCSDPSSLLSLQVKLFKLEVQLDAIVNLAVCRGHESDGEFAALHHLRINVVNPAYFVRRLCEFEQLNPKATIIFPEDNTRTYSYRPYRMSKQVMVPALEYILEEYILDGVVQLLRIRPAKFSVEEGEKLAFLVHEAVGTQAAKKLV